MATSAKDWGNCEQGAATSLRLGQSYSNSLRSFYVLSGGGGTVMFLISTERL